MKAKCTKIEYKTEICAFNKKELLVKKEGSDNKLSLL